MFKKLVLLAAAGAALAGAGTTALAQTTWSFELPDFQLRRDGGTVASVPGPFAAGTRATVTDASGDARFAAVFSPLHVN